MAGIRWDINTHGKTQATLAGATELRVVDDPSGAINSKKTTLTALAAFVKSVLGLTSSDISDFTEAAQDATGAMATNSARVSLAYVDGTPSLTADLISNSITAGYLHSGAAHTLFGNSTGAAGAGEDITLGAGLAFVGTTLTSTITQYTDAMAQAAVRVANSFDIANLHFTATARLAGRTTVGAGGGEEISVGAGLTLAAGSLSSSITQYTDEMAQDAVGTILTDTAEIDFTYNDAGNQITADLKTNSIVLGRVVNATQRAMVAASAAGAWAETALSANVFTMLGSANNAAIRSNIGAVSLSGDTMTGPLELGQTTSGITQTDAVLRIASTDAGVSGPTLTAYHNSASPAANDVMYRMRGYGNNTTPVAFFYGAVNLILDDPTAASEDAHWNVSTAVAGTTTTRLSIGGGVYHPSVTGGDKGNNTLNLGSLFQNNVAVATLGGNAFLANQTITSSSGAQLVMTAVRDDNVGVQFATVHQSTTPAANDIIALWSFDGYDSGNNITEYAGIRAVAIDPTDTSEDGAWQFLTTIAGLFAPRIQIGAGLYSANATSGDEGVESINFSSYYVNGNIFARSNGDLQNKIYTLATLPTAAAAGEQIAVSDLGGGAGVLVSKAASGAWMRTTPGYATAGDASSTIDYLTNAAYINQSTTLTADRALTMSNTNAYTGAMFEIERSSGGAFKLDLKQSGGTVIFTFPSGTTGIARFIFDGTDWQVWATRATGRGTLGDASVTVTVLDSPEFLDQSTTLTADRAITLSNTGAIKGSRKEIRRSSSGAFKLDVKQSGGAVIFTIPASAKGTAEFVHDGTDWQLFNTQTMWGTYTPTLTNSTNIAASTSGVCLFQRVGDFVTVSGQIQVDPTSASTVTLLGLSLPIASTLGAASDLSGVMGGPVAAGSASNGGYCLGDTTNNRASLTWSPTNIANQTYGFTFTYRVL